MIFWKHIKGVAATGNEYSWISWADGCPRLKVNLEGNKLDQAVDYGRFITDGRDWNLITNWSWYIADSEDETKIINEFAIRRNANQLVLSSTNVPLDVTNNLEVNLQLTPAPQDEEDLMHHVQINAIQGENTCALFSCEAKYNSHGLVNNDPAFVKVNTYVPLHMHQPCTCEESLHVKKFGLFDEYCRALYFSATSDRRAKENIQPNTLSALDFINNITVFSFNYKNHKETTIGIMAQDVINTEFKDLLVDNINATGLDGDYMSIKEDKLIFVLLKAIQEQQREIEWLKSQLKK